MKKIFLSTVAMVLLLSNTIAQEREEIRKSKTRSAGNEEIIIKRKAGKNAKVVIEIKDDEVLVNGKPMEDYESDDVTILRRKASTYNLVAPTSPFRSQSGTMYSDDSYDKLFRSEAAFLGVSAEEDNKGARVITVTKESAAEKAGLKEGDVITKVNETDIENPGDLTNTIRKMKPEDKVKISFERDGKKNTITATLGKRKNRSLGNMDHFQPHIQVKPHLETLPDIDFNFGDNFGQTFSFPGKGRIGIRAQDTEEGNGVKVIGVDEGSAADKAGIRKEDVILEFDGENIKSAEQLADIAKDRSDKNTFKVRLKREGKNETVEIKIPRKMKTSRL